MSMTQWLLLVTAIIYACLMALGIKYPRTRESWSRERRETLQIILSGTVFLMLFFALWYVSATVDWPDPVTILFWSGMLTLLALLLVGIFAPRGVRLRFEKKEEERPDEDGS